ncbi:MAG: hypothetical protein QM796_22960 [Chthoniobacteraceae bacterium]
MPLESSSSVSTAATEHALELHRNQFWEAAGTVVKTLFFFIVSPWILRRLGAEAFGGFALALSTMACVLSFDFGLRVHLRVLLSQQREQEVARATSFAGVIASFLLLGVILLPVTAVLGWLGGWSHWLHTSADGLIPAAVAFSWVYLLSLLLMEPLAARERLSETKVAVFLGNLLAIPAVLLGVWLRQPAMVLAIIYFLSLTLPNLGLVIVKLRGEFRAMLQQLPRVEKARVIGFFRDGQLAWADQHPVVDEELSPDLSGRLAARARAGGHFLFVFKVQ